MCSSRSAASTRKDRGKDGVAEARELLSEGSVRGLKFHPNIQNVPPQRS